MKTKRGGLYGFRNASKSDADNRRDFERWRGYTINGHRYDEYDPTVYWPGRTNPFMQPQLNFEWNRSLPTPQPIPEPIPPIPEDPVTRFRQTVASRKIANVIGPKYRARYLNRLCADSGVCFAFGQEKQQLMNFFRFTTFEYAVDPMKRIGDDSVNGFVQELLYTREGYNAYAILKSSLTSTSDNLAYEYLVGKYINDHFALYLPGFVETYGLFKYPSKEIQSQIKNVGSSTALKGMAFDPTDPNVCQSSDLLCILIQHIKGAKSMYTMIQDETFVVYDALYVFFQIYFTLQILRKKFTHYDLHGKNVLLYEPVVGGYIHYHYHTSVGDASFKSKYMAKMIDYGHSFFPEAMKYYQTICRIPECYPCGKKHGFNWFDMNLTDTYAMGYINGLYSNQSHDLKLLNFCKQVLQKVKMPARAIPYPLGEVLNAKYDGAYGTPEWVESGTIGSVTDVIYVLFRAVRSQAFIDQNDRYYASLIKIGDLHVYSDLKTPMEFIPTPTGGKRTRRSK